MDRTTAATDAALLGLFAAFALASLPMLRAATAPPETLALLLIPAGIGLSRSAASAGHSWGRATRAGWPVAIAPLVYMGEVAVVPHVPFPRVDAALTRMDVWLGLHAGHPDWAIGTLAEEVSSLAYLSYYAIPAVAVWVAWRYGSPALARLSLALALTSLACGLVWIALPSGGYHLAGGPSGPAFGPATELTRAIYASHPHYAAAFPSQHVAHTAATVAVLVRLGHRRLWWAWALAIWASTVYGEFHFALDGLAGVLVGAAAGFAATSWQPGPHPEPARAPAPIPRRPR